MKTLAQVEPRIPLSSFPTSITQPGSYYLTTNIVQTGVGEGLYLFTNNVTIDLNGFTMRGNGSPGTAIYGINLSNIVVKNGIITGWGNAGISLYPSANVTVKDVTVTGNGLSGIFAGTFATIESCTVQTNLIGINCEDRTVVRHCTVADSVSDGIRVGHGARIEESIVARNGGNGMIIGNNSTIERCSSTANRTNGAVVVDASRVADSVFSGNSANGLSATFGVQVISCTADGNSSNGIVVQSRCQVLNNKCYANFAAGILVNTNNFNFGGTRVEGNHVGVNATGIRVGGPGNFIIHNTSSGNSVNYFINSNNAVGPIVFPPNSGVINGSVGGAGVGTTDPHANFAF